MKKQNEKQMKNQTKKVVSVLCAAALFGSGAILGACGGKKGENKNVTISGSSSVTPLMEKLAAAYEQDHDVRITVNMSSSGAGISDAQNDLNDFGMSSRGLKASETGVKGETLCMDGIALIVNKECAVTDVKKADVKALYENGTALPDTSITAAVGRDASSGTRSAFDELFKNRERLFQGRCHAWPKRQCNRNDQIFEKQHRLHFLRQPQRFRESGESGRNLLHGGKYQGRQVRVATSFRHRT